MKLIVKTVAGSHLFGTATILSDRDYKGVFIPDAEDILLGHGKDTRNSTTGSSTSKNSKDDIDVELYSLTKFMKMVSDGDTSAIELLFTPKEMIIESTPEWDEIVRLREFLISKSIRNMVGYIKSQVNKYGIRGSRMGELGNFMDLMKQLDNDNPRVKLKVVWSKVEELLKNFEHIKVIKMTKPNKSDEHIPGIEVLRAKFDHDTSLAVVAKWCSDKYKKFGQRSREAKNNNGIDFKAVSHGIRVALQAKELLSTGKITLPHTGENLDLIMKAKLGNMDYKEFTSILEKLLDEVEDISKVSTVRENASNDVIKRLVLDFHYRSVIYY